MISFIDKIIQLSIKVLIILLTLVLLYSVAELIIIVFKSFIVKTEAFVNIHEKYDTTNLFLSTVQGIIAAVLMITIIIEVIYSLVEYLKKGEKSYFKIIIEIALIALVRHLLAIDIEHIDPIILVGTSALILVLGMFYLITHDIIKFNKPMPSNKNKQND